MCVTLKAFFFSHDVYQKSSAVIALISWFFFRCLLNFIFIYETEELAEEEILINLNWKGSIIINRQTRKFALLINIKRNCNIFSIRFIIYLFLYRSIATQDLNRIWMDGWGKANYTRKIPEFVYTHETILNTYMYVKKWIFCSLLFEHPIMIVYILENLSSCIYWNSLSRFKIEKKRGISVFPVVHFKYSFISFISTSRCNSSLLNLNY